MAVGAKQEEYMKSPIDRELLYKIVKRNYGESGIYALEASCLTPDDLMQGEAHCLARIGPALEEMNDGDF